MIGDNYNKLKKVFKKHKSGQVLLITIMLIGVVLTIVLSVTFTSRTETQLTKLEEENQKAFAAAEAGIEAALKQGTSIADLSTLNIPEGFTGSVTVSDTSGAAFVSPFLQAGQQSTFYLSNYPDFSSSFSGSMSFHYGSASGQSCAEIALEITFISGASPYTYTRYIADEPGDLLDGTDQNDLGQAAQTTVENVTFQCRTSNINVPANPKVVIVRPLFAGTKIGFSSTGAGFNPQGKYVTSEATSPLGVSKKIQLFQSLPQIPADFFVTSF